MRESAFVQDGLFENIPGSALAEAERQLRTPPPDISEVEASAFVKRYHGRTVTARLLSGERDRNFLVTDERDWSAILKFYNPADDLAARSLQNGVLVHLRGRSLGCLLPELYPTLDGHDEVRLRHGAIETAAVLISRVPGENPNMADLSPELRGSVGYIVGALSLALADYNHPSAARTILWDMMHVAELRPLTDLIGDRDHRLAVRRWIDRFAAEVLPAASALPQQVIHNDLSLSNLMVAPEDRSKIVGVIDFGDIVFAPRINELAIAASYFIHPDGDPVEAIAELLRGVGSNLGLQPDEVDLLPELIKARLVIRILLSSWRARLFPENRTYILRSNLTAWRLWERLNQYPALSMSRKLREFVGERPT